ncbi:MAG: sporulation integral membrane protein YtvI [Clostridia bacterium]|nr:sporulation integral membrane protein YtvI [Clostridia bacterium]
MNIQNKKNFLISFAYFAAWIVAIYILIKIFFKPLLPFVIAFVLATSVQRSAAFLNRRIKIKKSILALVMIFAIYLLLFIASILLIYIFSINFENIKIFTTNILTQIGDIVLQWKTFLEDYITEISGTSINFENVMSNSASDIVGNMISTLSKKAVSFFSKIPEIMINIVVTLVASCYIAYDYDKLKKFIFSLIGINTKQKIIRIKNIFKNSVLTIFRGYLLLMILTFFELLVGFWIIGFRPALLFASVISIVDILPVLGTGTVLLPWAIFSFFSGNKLISIGIIILYLVITFIRNFAEPHIIGKKLGLSPLVMLIAIFLGFRLMGLIGVILLPILLIIIYEYNKPENLKE